ncbi:MAG TPA: C39 family peptidase [Terracidiphilus sp.]|nr:C39 family peptidase [Terracidiphilus sp.]
MIAKLAARCTAFLVLALPVLTGTAWAETPAPVWIAPVWIDVPFVHQPREGCGAASIAMVMRYWAAQQGNGPSADSDVAAIQRQLYSPREHGIAAEQVGQYLRQHGFQVFALNGSWSDLKEQLTKGRPLIAALKPRGQRELHYVVIDGIDAERGLVTMNDPAERKLLTRERAGFEREWSATHNWLLLAVPASTAR